MYKRYAVTIYNIEWEAPLKLTFFNCNKCGDILNDQKGFLKITGK